MEEKKPSPAFPQPPTNRVRSFQAALNDLGLEEKTVREGREASLQRAKAEAQKPSEISEFPNHQISSSQLLARKLPSWR